ncbi:MAG: 50S ribosomal protein L24 [Patescibacteria group bacterium]
MALKKNDNIIVISGKDKGKKAKVLRVLRSIDKVMVEGINVKNKHQKPRKEGEKGQTIQVNRPMAISNVALYCGTCGKGVRTGSKLVKDKKTRVCVKCGGVL